LFWSIAIVTGDGFEPQISNMKITSLGIESRSSIQRHASLPVIAFHV